MNTLIGISGKPRAGKDTVAQILVSKYGFKQYAFAEHLKWLAYTYFGWDKEVLWGNKTMESRKFLQDLGRLMTSMDTNYFVSSLIDKIKKDYYIAKEQNIPFRAVVSDVRRLDEIRLFDRSSTTFLIHDYIMDSGVSLRNAFDNIFIIRIDRDLDKILALEPGLAQTIEDPVENLEKVYDSWDYLLDNNDTIPTLENKVDSMIQYIWSV